ncbi:MAG: LysM peptidoglycan-binding domain-containing protein [Anaerolineaceae bacterium]|nr:LysM peptidoglycan-binding domain-containing protein [Anaerolineaceae bacterium]
MTKKHIRIIPFLALLLCLCACGGRDKYEPFTPLSKETISPEREAALQAALNGAMPTATTAPISFYSQPEAVAPTFDEIGFFAEIEPTATEEIPFVIEDTVTPTPFIPTDTPMPTATKPYDPNIMMYGTSNGLTTYTMQRGDFLICLGRRFNVSLNQLMAQNGISTPDELGVGDTVLLPRNPSPWSLMDGYGNQRLIMHPTTYITQEGDTLFSIACSYGDVLPEDIAVQNRLVLGEPLPAGLNILIP